MEQSNRLEASIVTEHLPKIYIIEYDNKFHCDNCKFISRFENAYYFSISDKIYTRDGVMFYFKNIEFLLLQNMDITIDNLNYKMIGNILTVKKTEL